MQLRTRSLSTQNNSSVKVNESSHSVSSESSEYSESSIARNSSVERLEAEKRNKENVDTFQELNSSPNRPSSLFSKFRSYLSSLVKRRSDPKSDTETNLEETEESFRELEHNPNLRKTLFNEFSEERTETYNSQVGETSQDAPSQESRSQMETNDPLLSESQNTDKAKDFQPAGSLKSEFESSSIYYSAWQPQNQETTPLPLSVPKVTRLNSRNTRNKLLEKQTQQNNRTNLLNSAKSESKAGGRRYTSRNPDKGTTTLSKHSSRTTTQETALETSSLHHTSYLPEDQLSQALSENFSENMSFQELRSLCKRLGIKATGKKMQLIGKIRAHLKAQETNSDANTRHVESNNVMGGTGEPDDVQSRALTDDTDKAAASEVKRRKRAEDEKNSNIEDKPVYSLETVALARAVLQHLQSQERTISVEEYQLYQNILKSAVQKPTLQVDISEEQKGGSMTMKKRARRNSSQQHTSRKRTRLVSERTVEISVLDDTDYIRSDRDDIQNKLKQQKLQHLDISVKDSSCGEDWNPNRSYSPYVCHPMAVTSSTSQKEMETKKSGTVTPVDVVRTFLGSTETPGDSKMPDQINISPKAPFARSAFTTPTVKVSLKGETSFLPRGYSRVEHLQSKNTDDWRLSNVKEEKHGLGPSHDKTRSLTNSELPKERVYDFRQGTSTTPSKAATSDTARRILETLNRIAGNSVERKKAPPVTLDSIRKKRRAEDYKQNDFEENLKNEQDIPEDSQNSQGKSYFTNVKQNQENSGRQGEYLSKNVRTDSFSYSKPNGEESPVKRAREGLAQHIKQSSSLERPFLKDLPTSSQAENENMIHKKKVTQDMKTEKEKADDDKQQSSGVTNTDEPWREEHATRTAFPIMSSFAERLRKDSTQIGENVLKSEPFSSHPKEKESSLNWNEQPPNWVYSPDKDSLTVYQNTHSGKGNQWESVANNQNTLVTEITKSSIENEDIEVTPSEQHSRENTKPIVESIEPSNTRSDNVMKENVLDDKTKDEEDNQTSQQGADSCANISPFETQISEEKEDSSQLDENSMVEASQEVSSKNENVPSFYPIETSSQDMLKMTEDKSPKDDTLFSSTLAANKDRSFAKNEFPSSESNKDEAASTTKPTFFGSFPVSQEQNASEVSVCETTASSVLSSKVPFVQLSSSGAPFDAMNASVSTKTTIPNDSLSTNSNDNLTNPFAMPKNPNIAFPFPSGSASSGFPMFSGLTSNVQTKELFPSLTTTAGSLNSPFTFSAGQTTSSTNQLFTCSSSLPNFGASSTNAPFSTFMTTPKTTDSTASCGFFSFSSSANNVSLSLFSGATNSVMPTFSTNPFSSSSLPFGSQSSGQSSFSSQPFSSPFQFGASSSNALSSNQGTEFPNAPQTFNFTGTTSFAIGSQTSAPSARKMVRGARRLRH